MKSGMKRLCLIVVISMLLLTACGTGGKTAGHASGNVSTHEVTDCAGRVVAVPDEIDSLSCLYAYAGHACVVLGQEEKITSLVAGLQRDLLMKRKIPDIDDLPVPYSDQAINLETLLASSPDLVLLRGEAMVNEGERQKLEKAGIPYVVIDYVTMEEQKKSLTVLGQVLGCEEKAQAYLDYYEEKVQQVKDCTAQIPEKERLSVFHSVNEVVRTDVPGSLTDEMLEAAGLINVIHEGGELAEEENKVFASVEQIYLWDPDWIICNEPSATAYYETDEKMAGLRAVREGRVLQLPVGISRWCHPGSIETPIALLYLGKTLYPDYFEEVDLDQEVKAFYKDFIGIELTDKDLEEIYSGQGMRVEKEKNQTKQ